MVFTQCRRRVHSSLQVEILFQPALVGMFVLTLYEGRGLGAHDPVLRPNPYVVAALGET